MLLKTDLPAGVARRSSTAARGFTLIELVVVLAVAGILLSLSIPGLGRLVMDNRRTATLNALVTSFNYARSEAVSMRTSVAVCKSDNAGSQQPLCTEAGGWENGWLVFIDHNDNGAREPDETLLRQHEPVTGDVTLRGNTKLADSVIFRAHGSTSNNGRLIYCDRRGWSADAKVVVVATTGRSRIARVSDDGNTPLTDCMRS